MEVLVVYDVSTEDPKGRRRLRQVAKICEGYGQRVQKSVFECTVDAPTLRRLIAELRDTIDPVQDRAGIYRLREPYVRYVVSLGNAPSIDWRRPLVL